MTPSTPSRSPLATVLSLGLGLALVVALLPAAAFARPGHGPRGGEHGRRGLLPPPGFLDLTAEQRAAAREIFESARDAAEPKRDALRDLHDQLRTALEADAPEPAAVGALVIQLDGVRDELKATFEGAQASFVALLTDEQRQRYEAFRELRPRPFGERGRHGRRGGGDPDDGLFGGLGEGDGPF